MDRLGSGPGLLADEIEKNFLPQKYELISENASENKLSRKNFMGFE